MTIRRGLRGAAVTMALMVLLVAGCASPVAVSPPATVPSDPVDAIAEKMTQALERERFDSVSEILLSKDSGSVTFVKGGVWKTWTISKGREEAREAYSPMPSRLDGVTVSEAVDMTKRLRHRCSERSYEVSLSVVSRTATLAKATCTNQHYLAATLLNGEELPVLSGGWTQQNLESVWREVRLITGAQVESMRLDDGAAWVTLLDQGTSCSVYWRRFWVVPENRGASVSCVGGASDRTEGPISLDRFTAARVATAVASGCRELGITDTSKVKVRLDNTERTTGDFKGRYRVWVTRESGSAVISADGW